MSREVSVSFGSIGGTAAGLGSNGRLSLVADRPDGVARGSGLGFNGGELLALSIGGCLWNDIHYVAEDAGLTVLIERIEVTVSLAGTPPRVVRARVEARLSGAPEADLDRVFDGATATSTVANSIAPAILVTFERTTAGGTT